ncbi:hypothetical protein [Endozoicomonas sp. 2B-B]
MNICRVPVKALTAGELSRLLAGKTVREVSQSVGHKRGCNELDVEMLELPWPLLKFWNQVKYALWRAGR